jgi:hypothetical protein
MCMYHLFPDPSLCVCRLSTPSRGRAPTGPYTTADFPPVSSQPNDSDGGARKQPVRGLLASTASYAASTVAPSAPTMTELTAAAESTTTLDNLSTSYEPPVPTAIGALGIGVNGPRKSKGVAVIEDSSSSNTGGGGAEEKTKETTRASGADASKEQTRRAYI